MKSNQEYKNRALEALKGNWASAVVASIILVAASYFLAVPYVSTYLYQFISVMWWGLGVGYVGFFFVYMPLNAGVTYAYSQLYMQSDGRVAGNTLDNMAGNYLKVVWTMFLYCLYTFLWSLLFLIPGIIKAYSYALTPYILKDNPELSANEMIDLSRAMMRGHKFDLFCLHLSFIGWAILCIFTGGIGTLWLMPYMLTAQAAFYQDVRTEYMSKQ